MDGWIAVVFAAPGVFLLFLSPLTLPVALGCFAHAWLVPWLQARRGARAVMPLGERATARRQAADPGRQPRGLGLLA